MIKMDLKDKYSGCFKDFISFKNCYVINFLSIYQAPGLFRDKRSSLESINDFENILETKKYINKDKDAFKNPKKGRLECENKIHKKVKSRAQGSVDIVDTKRRVGDMKQMQTSNTIFNENGQMVFTKIHFPALPGSKLKTTHAKIIKNPVEILKKIKKTETKIRMLKTLGDDNKILKMKTNVLWKKAIDMVEGKKVKDDRRLLYISIKKREDKKQKSKHNWMKRRNKLENNILEVQRKRRDNINKKIINKQSRKIKKK